ncbi:MAG: lipocalin-like domain-containing protein, partial [Pseudomonadota bacterium]
MRGRVLGLLLVLCPLIASGQSLDDQSLDGPGFDGLGFDGLRETGDAFSLPDPGTVLTFPDDHGPHDGFRIEWWYVTANLIGPDGTDYGAQWTLFRNALAPQASQGWGSPVIWMAHAAVTTPQTHYSAERFARGGIGQAGVTAEPFEAWIDDWSMAGPNFEDITITAQDTDFAYDLD